MRFVSRVPPGAPPALADISAVAIGMCLAFGLVLIARDGGNAGSDRNARQVAQAPRGAEAGGSPSETLTAPLEAYHPLAEKSSNRVFAGAIKTAVKERADGKDRPSHQGALIESRLKKHRLRLSSVGLFVPDRSVGVR